VFCVEEQADPLDPVALGIDRVEHLAGRPQDRLREVLHRRQIEHLLQFLGREALADVEEHLMRLATGQRRQRVVGVLQQRRVLDLFGLNERAPQFELSTLC
jgi:hypothetical protein